MAATLLALAGSYAGIVWRGWPVFALCVFVAFSVQWLAFIPAYIFQTERFYDLTGSATYLATVCIAYTLAARTDPRAVLLLALVAIWAVRLGGFLFLRILQDRKDSRFDAIKPDAWRFFTAWMLQGLWVSFTAAAAWAAITAPQVVELGWLGVLGALLWLTGFSIEVVADRQKRRFKAWRKQAGANAQEFISSGLWSRSRHPNYFGEILLWFGIALIALPALVGWQWVTLLSPLFVYLLLTRVSGIPMLERQADKRWGDDASYQQYKKTTPVLFPRLR